MKHTFIPALRADGVFGIIPNDIEQRLQNSQGKRFRVLRHEQRVCTPLPAHLMNVFCETFRFGQIDHTTRLAAMTVSAGDDRLVPSFGKMQDRLVFLPAAEAPKFQRMDEHSVLSQKRTSRASVELLANVGEVPQ